MERNSVHPTNRDALLLRSESRSHPTTSSDFVLQWGNRKRLRCMKFQTKDNPSGSGPPHRAMTRIDRRVVRSDFVEGGKSPVLNQLSNGNAGKSNGGGNGYLNLRQRPASPSHRILRNSEMSSIGMRGGNSNGGDRKGGTFGNNNSTHNTSNNNDSHHHHHHGGSASSSGGEAITVVWPPKFVMGLTNKEKEEDFMAIKGSKLPQRPKKRAKYIQRTLNLVSPGAWLSDLTLERYEVREKKVSKKKARGLKAMGGNMNVDSESE